MIILIPKSFSEKVAALRRAILPIALVMLLLGPCPQGLAAALEPVIGGPVAAGTHTAPETVCFSAPTLKVMTLNMAHGRKTAFHQMFLSQEEIQQNLADIGLVIKKAAPDIVALQEADGPSWWSGNFDHVALLANKAGLPWYSRAGYMQIWSLDYGAAMLARRPYLEIRGWRFESSFPTPAKGFLWGRFCWHPKGAPEQQKMVVDAVSVHLDFLRREIQLRQVEEMRTFLKSRGKNPLIIMGDFNSDGGDETSAVRELARQGKLQVYRPDAPDLDTFGARRLDWILISNQLQFVSYHVHPTVLSDHLALFAEIKMKP